MDIWTSNKWQSYYTNIVHRSGIRIICETGVNTDVKHAIHNLVVWLRQNYEFPMRIHVYVKKTVFVKALDGDLVRDRFVWPYNRSEEPYITIGTGDYDDLLKYRNKDDALATILMAFLENVAHYYQWLNDMDFSSPNLKRQARLSARRRLNEYSANIEHL